MVHRIVISSLVLAFGCGLGLASASASSDFASQHDGSILSTTSQAKEVTPCVRTSFKLPFVKEACAKGGQKAVGKTWKAFIKKAKAATGEKINCKSCHTKMKPDYQLKSDAYATYERLKKAVADAKIGLSHDERTAVEQFTHARPVTP